MTKGRKRIPTKIHILQGGKSKTHRDLNDSEPMPPEKIPRCPKHLDKEARKEWRRASKLLQDVGLLTDLDMAVLAGYCDAYSQWAQATVEVQTKGMIYKKADGSPGLNPFLRVAREAYDRMMKAAVLIGMSPSSRAGLKVEKKKPKDEADEFLKQCKK